METTVLLSWSPDPSWELERLGPLASQAQPDEGQAPLWEGWKSLSKLFLVHSHSPRAVHLEGTAPLTASRLR